MFAKPFTFGAPAALAAASGAALLALFLAAAPAHAQRFHVAGGGLRVAGGGLRVAGGGFRVPGTGGTLNPGNYYDPYGFSRRAAFNTALYGRAMSHVPPYALGYGGYGTYSGSYGGYYGGGYGGGYGGYGSSGPEYIGPDSVWGVTPPPKPVLTAEEKDVRSLLTASGVPTAEGEVVWPLALRVLPDSEAAPLRGQIGALLQTAATQAARGRPNGDIVEELGRATDQLRKLLVRQREERGGLAATSYDDAERFLDKLGGARTLLRVSLAPARAAREGEGGSQAGDYRP
jgi:hypothetical protein